MTSDNIRFLFWIVIFFIVALVLYGVAHILLPRLVIYGQLPDTEKSLYVDNADALAERISNGVCNLWLARISFNSGFESVVDYRVTSGSVGESLVADKLNADCSEVTGHWRYEGDVMHEDSTYEVKITMASDVILINVNKK